MSKSALYRVRIRDRRTERTVEFAVPSDRYILEVAEELGIELPFACRQGACTACAVRVRSGTIDQREVVGLSKALQAEGYALICSGYACSDLELETQDEDEVYRLQFGRLFDRLPRRRPWFQFPFPEEE